MGTKTLIAVEASPETHSIGCLDEAKDIIYRTYRSSKAYRNFVAAATAIKTEQKFRELPWEQIPITSKETLYEIAEITDLMPAENILNISSYLRSSGSSRATSGGKGFFWPQLRESVNYSMQQWKKRVVEIFQLQHRKTLAIIGLGLGSWSGGDRYNLMLKSLALETTYPLSVFSPGTALPEIVEIITKFGAIYDQVLIIIGPSAIFHLEQLAKHNNVPLPYQKLAFILVGEGFHEDLRKHAQQQALPNKMTFMSNYASADAELTGLESPELAEVRQTLSDNPDYADAIGLNSRSIPNMFHAFKSAGYLENVGGRMTITRWQGLPLARYDLHDSVQFFRWQALCSALARLTGEHEKWLAYSRRPHTDVVAVFGRSDQCLVFYGNNLYANMLEGVLMRSTLGPSSTGNFVVWPTDSGGCRTLNWQVELKSGVELSDQLINQHYASLVSVLAQQHPSFGAYVSGILSPQGALSQEMFRFFFCNEPNLLNNPRYRLGIKKRIIIPTGPI